MKSFEYDLKYLQAGLEVIEDYLLSSEVFWRLSADPPPGAPDYPQLTLGSLLLSKVRLPAYTITHEQETIRQQVILELERARSKWRVAWENKARRCFGVRVRMWADFLEEYKSNPPENADRYSYEVRLRVMLELLLAECGRQNLTEANQLSELDGYIKSVLEKGGFIWESDVQSGFPVNVYWYLYGRLPSGVK